MKKVAGWATGPKQDMQNFTPESREYKKADIRYRQARFNLGDMIKRHITVIKTFTYPIFQNVCNNGLLKSINRF
ncbi:hypothetical protein P4S63_18970 [Pseudoalteromonas sp. B193]